MHPQAIRRCWRRPPGTGPAHPVAQARALAIIASDMSTPSTWPCASTRAASARLDPPAPQPTDVQHAFAGSGRRGVDRSLSEHREHGVQPGLVGDPTLSALVIPIRDPITSLLCHIHILPRPDPLLTRLSTRMIVAAVRSDEHGDGRPAIGFDLVVIRSFRLIEACDNRKIGAFEKCCKQAG